MRTISAEVGGVSVTLEVADNDRDRSRGFMFRESCPEHHGILFVYDRDVDHGYTMKNVSIPLSIAFMNEHMRIMEVIDMQPGISLYMPSQPYRYALEMPKGWFETHCRNSQCSIDL